MDNVLQDMVQRLRAIELLLRTQNELLTRVLAEVKQNKAMRGGEQKKLRLLSRTITPNRKRRTKKQVLRLQLCAPASAGGLIKGGTHDGSSPYRHCHY